MLRINMYEVSSKNQCFTSKGKVKATKKCEREMKLTGKPKQKSLLVLVETNRITKEGISLIYLKKQRF